VPKATTTAVIAPTAVFLVQGYLHYILRLKYFNIALLLEMVMTDIVMLLNILDEVSREFDHLHFGFWLPLAENRLHYNKSLLFD
jgi:hypothetical protein